VNHLDQFQVIRNKYASGSGRKKVTWGVHPQPKRRGRMVTYLVSPRFATAMAGVPAMVLGSGITEEPECKGGRVLGNGIGIPQTAAFASNQANGQI
jgi:hypothetical protein